MNRLLLMASGLLMAFLSVHPPQPSPNDPYPGSGQILKTFHRDSARGGADAAAFAFSCIGEYALALRYNDQNYTPRWTRPGVVTAHDTAFMQRARRVSAKAYILQQAPRQRIIILNEAHHNPRHRVFTASLLKGLYQAGFRYLGAETLAYPDSMLNKRKYPLLGSGYYTKEPQYGNLIREALDLGYRVFPYEARTKEDLSSGKNRELAQARIIAQLVEQDPQAKILLHCGYDHVVEVPLTNSWQKAMAGRVKELTGIDPLTIDQQQWTEMSQPAKEHPLYQVMTLTSSSVFLNQQQEPYPGLALGRTDLQVAHPRTQYKHGRPDWLLRGGAYKPYFLTNRQLALGFPCRVLAYRQAEFDAGTKPFQTAIPLDVMELRGWQPSKALILPPGHYQLRVVASDGQQQTFNLVHR